MHIQNIRKWLGLLFSIGVAHLKTLAQTLHLIKSRSENVLEKFQMLEFRLQTTINSLFEKAE